MINISQSPKFPNSSDGRVSISGAASGALFVYRAPKPQRNWIAGTLEPWNLLLGCKTGPIIDTWEWFIVVDPALLLQFSQLLQVNGCKIEVQFFFLNITLKRKPMSHSVVGSRMVCSQMGQSAMNSVVQGGDLPDPLNFRVKIMASFEHGLVQNRVAHSIHWSSFIIFFSH